MEIPNSRVLRLPLFLALFACLSVACTTIQLVPAYDEQIDASLTQLNTDLVEFVLKMNSAAGTPQGTYASNQEFYIEERAKVQTIAVRADAHKILGSCPSTQLIESALAHSQQLGGSAASYQAQIPPGDCEVALISLIQTGFDQLETFHRARAKGIPAAATGPILQGGLGALIEAAIVVEIAKKSGKTTG
jgi:hypothetical protein